MRAAVLFLICLAGPGLAQTPGELLYAPQTGWEGIQTEINWSTYAFSDRNHNGIYDMGDQPMASVFSALAKNGVGHAVALSNAAGFGNFTVSAGKPSANINEPGDYIFEIVIPPGWVLTTGNRSQPIAALPMQDGAVGLVMDRSLTPMGLAPIPKVSGVYGGTGRAVLSLRRDGVDIASVEVEPGQPFSLAAELGRLELTDGTTSRTVDLDAFPVNVGNFAPRAYAQGQADLVDFEAFAGYDIMKIPTGYAGLEWHDLNAIERKATIGSEGYVNGLTSGDFTAYTTNVRPGEIKSDTGFDLVSAELSVAWRKAEGETVLIEAWSGQTKIAEDRIVLSALGPVRYAPGLTQVTRLLMTTEHGWQLVMDDLRILPR